ncbi:MAG: galactose mutarotase [Treponema sp.]|jgi:aldose 1-epimerase|nr:galactose mutarotase [Treponema sp.]
MKISKKTFGLLSDGNKVHLYTLEAGDLSLSISTFGATWTSLTVPSKSGGTRDDIVLGFSSLEGYFHCPAYFGATIGRFANRIGGGAFTLGGKGYSLCKNDGGHTLHGGRRGFDKRLWKAYPYTGAEGVFVRFERLSPRGEEGFPGKLRAAVTYGINDSNEISALYQAWVDAPCPVNLTNHVYFNLAGEGSGDILSHEVKLYASSYVESKPDLIPTGKLLPTAGTPFDFTGFKPVKQDFAAVCGGDAGRTGTGYDHCFVIDGSAGELRPCAEVRDPASGRGLKLAATQPGLQFYTGNFLDGVLGKPGSVYRKNDGFCLETQHFPDSPNQGAFPSSIYGPDRDYCEKAVFSFTGLY